MRIETSMDEPTEWGSMLAGILSLAIGVVAAISLYRWVLRHKAADRRATVLVSWMSVFLGTIAAAVTMRFANGPRVLMYSDPERQQLLVVLSARNVLVLAVLISTVFAVGLFFALSDDPNAS